MRDDWEALELVHDVLHVRFFFIIIFVIVHSSACFQETTEDHQSFSKMKRPLLHRSIPVMKIIHEQWSMLKAQFPEYDCIKYFLQAALQNLHKRYWRLNDTNIHVICLGTCHSDYYN